MANRVVQANRTSQVSVQNTRPVAHILSQERLVQAILMTQGADVCWSCPFSEHLQNGIARYQMDEQKYQRDHQPDNRNGENETCQNLLHGLDSTINQLSSL